MIHIKTTQKSNSGCESECEGDRRNEDKNFTITEKSKRR